MSDILFELPEQQKPQTSVVALSAKDFRDYGDGELRVVDWRLAEQLDYGYTPNVRKLIERYRTRLERHGNLLHRGINSRRRGRPATEFYLNFEQAIFIIIKSDAPNADAAQDHVIEIYAMWARDDLVPRDAAAELKAADATARAFDAAPELMQLVKPALVEAAVDAIRAMNIVRTDDIWKLEDSIRYEVEKQLKPIKEASTRTETAVVGMECDLWTFFKRDPDALQRRQHDRSGPTASGLPRLVDPRKPKKDD